MRTEQYHPDVKTNTAMSTLRRYKTKEKHKPEKKSIRKTLESLTNNIATLHQDATGGIQSQLLHRLHTNRAGKTAKKTGIICPRIHLKNKRKA